MIDPLALRRAFERFRIEGTPRQDYGPPYAVEGPWYVIDTEADTASKHEDYGGAVEAFWTAVAGAL